MMCFRSKILKSLVLVPILLLATISGASSVALGASRDFPMGPDAQMTPGSLCDHPSTVRYPERIPYCSRDVTTGLKNEIIREYDEQLGFNVRRMRRGDFKIDHYIPLCAGGSNNQDNLWPQHKSVYAITDPLEPLVCEKMAAGRLSQAEAIEFIKEAKNDLSKAPAIIDQIQSL